MKYVSSRLKSKPKSVMQIKGRLPLVPRRQGYMVRLNFETTVNLEVQVSLYHLPDLNNSEREHPSTILK